MAVALGNTLRALGVGGLLQYGKWKEIYDRTTNGTDMFIGCWVTEKGESNDDIDRCEEDEMPLGIITGYAPPDVSDTEEYLYRDFDNKFANNKKVNVGDPESKSTILMVSGTNKTIAKGDPLKIVEGCVEVADTGDDIIAIAKTGTTAAANTKKWLYAEIR